MAKQRFEFKEAITIEGYSSPINFYFIAEGSTSGDIPGYKVHSFNPKSNFHLYTNVIDRVSFHYTDESNLPKWLSDDKDSLRKLNNAILNNW